MLAVRNRLKRGAVNSHSKFGEQAETIAGLRCTEDELWREISNVPLGDQAQAGAIIHLKRGEETAVANFVPRMESQAAHTMLTSEQDSLLDVIHRVEAMSPHSKEKSDGVDLLIENPCVSLGQEKLRADRENNKVHDSNQEILGFRQFLDKLSESVQQEHQSVAPAIDG